MSRARRRLLDRAVRVIAAGFGLMALVPLVWIVAFVTWRGAPAFSWELLTTLPRPPGESGGGLVHAITGSFMLVGMAFIAALPLGVACGALVAHWPRLRIVRMLGFLVEVLQGLPSIAMGIVVYALVVHPSREFSALAGSIALALLMVPVVARATEEALRRVPTGLWESSLALGGSQASTLLRVALPAARAGILTGALLAVSRASGETAPLLFTAFGNSFVSWDPTGPVHALPMAIYHFAVSPWDEWHRLAWGGAFVLLWLVLSLNLLARILLDRQEN